MASIIDDAQLLIETELADGLIGSFLDAALDQTARFEEGTELVDERILDQYTHDFQAHRAAVRTLAQRDVVSPQKFRKIATAARERAFTVTANITNQARADIRDTLVEQLENGVSPRKFAESVSHLPLSPGHVQQVFRNNINTAYSEGVEAILDEPIVGEQFPYRAYRAIMDDRVRSEHLLLERLGIQGTNIYHKDDPVWRMFRPPWSWNCRCGWRPVSIREAARKGILEAQEWLETGVEPAHEFVTPPPFQPDPLWLRDHGNLLR